MANGGRSFSAEFKLAALERMAQGESPTALAAELGIGRTLLYRWRKTPKAGGGGGEGDRPCTRVAAKARTAARSHADDALETLAAIMNDPKGSVASRVAAANAVLDRALGRPGQPVEAKTKRKSPIKRIEWVIVRPQDRDG
jgi:transposase-like protein